MGMEETVANRIIRLREAAGLSQKELANKSGAGYGSIQSWEQNSERIPTLKSAEKLAKALGTTSNAILFPDSSNQENTEERETTPSKYKIQIQTAKGRMLREVRIPSYILDDIVTMLDQIYLLDEEVLRNDIYWKIKDVLGGLRAEEGHGKPTYKLADLLETDNTKTEK